MEPSPAAVQILPSSYKGWSSVTMETAQIRLELVPGLGGKIVSLRFKPTGKEWLLDAGARALTMPAYGSGFGDADMSGWDECFPTINPCAADKEGRILLPDHGEVWSLPWHSRIGRHNVACSVSGVKLLYLLTRVLSFTTADTLRFDYGVANRGMSSWPFLWVPHPQFAVTEPTRIVLPPSVEELLCVFGGKTMNAGERYAAAEISLVTETFTGDGRKWYVPGKLAEGWCGLLGENSGDWLRMQVPPDLVPYFGVWVDEGMVNDRNAIALEPSIGYYDALDRARDNGSAPILKPGEAYSWSLELRLGSRKAGDTRSASQILEPCGPDRGMKGPDRG